jgi:acetyl esterase/lipase
LNYFLPSYDYYGRNPAFTSIGVNGIRLALWYLGETDQYPDFEAEIRSGKHLLLIEDKKHREKLVSYVKPDYIPEEYKMAKKFYADQTVSFDDSLIEQELEETHIFKTNEKYQYLAKSFLSLDLSPGLVDDDTLKRSPKTFMVICELDSLKDECLIYTERLRRLGVPVEMKYYETGYHGMIVAIKKRIYSNRNSRKMCDDIINYIKANIES